MTGGKPPKTVWRHGGQGRAVSDRRSTWLRPWLGEMGTLLSYRQSHQNQPQPSRITATNSQAMGRFSELLGFMVGAVSTVEFK